MSSSTRTLYWSVAAIALGVAIYNVLLVIEAQAGPNALPGEILGRDFGLLLVVIILTSVLAYALRQVFIAIAPKTTASKKVIKR